MNGPGRALKEPLPGSTNYLGAYDKYGNLVRAGPGWRRGDPVAPKTPKQPEPTDEKAADETAASDETDLDALEAAIRTGEPTGQDAKPKKDELEDEDTDELPPETAEDLRPFPLNSFFRSQPVLSEELREAIYQRVKKDGATVPLASVEYGVSNERVGAVVRLKQMEKEWISQVCWHTFPYSLAPLDMMRLLKIRLVFKTSTWLQNLKSCSS